MNRLAILLAGFATLAPSDVRSPPATIPASRPQAIAVDVEVPVPPRAVAAEGRWHLVYELHLRNFGRTELRLERVEVTDQAGRTLLDLTGAALDGTILRPASGPDEARGSLPGGRFEVVFLDVTVPAAGPPPERLGHRLSFRPVVTVDGSEQSLVTPPPIPVRREAGPAFGAPLRGGCWVASHGLDNQSSHRRTFVAVGGRERIAQRYAIDWIRIGADGQAFRRDPADNRNWSAYGAEVLAMADGRVVEALDGIPQNDPTADHKAVPITLTSVGGNHILLDAGQGRYIFYAHLQPGSLRVRPGQVVRRGAVIALLGNSGQSDAPHLHVHIVDAPSPLGGEGRPLAFEQFLLQGHLPSLRVLTDGTGWHPSEAAVVRRREMPLENAVVRFGGGDSPCG